MQSSSLSKRISEGNLRALQVLPSDLIDFTSNDYLGLARSEELHKLIALQKITDVRRVNGSTGSRLLSGNSTEAEALETFIAEYHQADCGLLFNSGYDANLGLFSCIAGRGDTILYDEMIHASVIDGLRLSHAHTYKFRHNDLKHLEQLLTKAVGQLYVAVESLYSMDGDFSPLSELTELCRVYKAGLIVDEAHATGLYGNSNRGEGRVSELGLQKSVFARLHTFGKALGCHGAIVLGSSSLRDHLVNFSRPFIFSTALPLYSLQAIRCAYEMLERHPLAKSELHSRIQYFNQKVTQAITISKNPGPIQHLLVSGNKRVKALALGLQASGYDARPITSPTVPQGKERIRICIHSFNTSEQIDGLMKAIDNVLDAPDK